MNRNFIEYWDGHGHNMLLELSTVVDAIREMGIKAKAVIAFGESLFRPKKYSTFSFWGWFWQEGRSVHVRLPTYDFLVISGTVCERTKMGCTIYHHRFSCGYGVGHDEDRMIPYKATMAITAVTPSEVDEAMQKTGAVADVINNGVLVAGKFKEVEIPSSDGWYGRYVVIRLADRNQEPSPEDMFEKA